MPAGRTAWSGRSNARACPDSRVVKVRDREGDFRERFSRAEQTGAALLVRASRGTRRRVAVASGGDAELWVMARRRIGPHCTVPCPAISRERADAGGNSNVGRDDTGRVVSPALARRHESTGECVRRHPDPIRARQARQCRRPGEYGSAIFQAGRGPELPWIFPWIPTSVSARKTGFQGSCTPTYRDFPMFISRPEWHRNSTRDRTSRRLSAIHKDSCLPAVGRCADRPGGRADPACGGPNRRCGRTAKLTLRSTCFPRRTGRGNQGFA